MTGYRRNRRLQRGGGGAARRGSPGGVALAGHRAAGRAGRALAWLFVALTLVLALAAAGGVVWVEFGSKGWPWSPATPKAAPSSTADQSQLVRARTDPPAAPGPDNALPAAGPVASIMVRVVDAESGAPVAGASVKVTRDEPPAITRQPRAPAPAVVAEAETGPDGVTRVNGPEGAAWVSADHPSSLPGRASRPANAPADLVTEVPLSPAAFVEGTVVNAAGKPVAGAEICCFVKVEIASYEPNPAAVTDGEGAFRFRAMPGAAVVHAAHPDYVTDREAVTTVARATTQVHFKLQVGAVLVGDVTDAGGKPVTDFQVGADGHYFPQAGAACPADGHYRLAGLEPGQALVVTLAAPIQGIEGVANIGPLPTGETRLDIRLPVMAVVRGKAQYASGAELGSVVVRVDRRGGWQRSGKEPGRFVFAAMIKGTDDEKAAPRPAAPPVVVGEDGVTVFSVSDNARDAGGDGSADGEFAVVTGATYRTAPLLSGSYNMTVALVEPDLFNPGRRLARAWGLASGDRPLVLWETRFQLKEGEAEKVLDIIVPDLATLAGHVLDASGAPVAGARVAFAPQDANFSLLRRELNAYGTGSVEGALWPQDHFLFGAPERRVLAKTGADGAFTARAPAGDYTVAILHPAHPPLLVKEPLKVAAGAKIDGLEYRFGESGSISGIVRDQAGKEIADATVTVTGDRGATLGKENTGPDGRYRIAGVPPGTVNVAASGAGFPPVVRRDVAVTASPETTVDFSLAPGAKLTVVVTNEAGEPVIGADVRAIRHGESGISPGEETGKINIDGNQGSDNDKANRYQFTTLAAGQHRLRVEAKGLLPAVKIVEVAAGADLEERVTLAAGLAVSGVVVNEAGEGIKRANVNVSPEEFDASEDYRYVEATADDDGRFTITGLAVGAYSVSANASGYVQGHLAGVAAGGPPIRITLARAGSISGMVLRSDGSPVEEFDVTASSWPSGGRVFWPQSDGTSHYPEGKFTVGDIDGGGTYEVVVRAQGYAPGRSGKIDVAKGQAVEGLVLRLTAGGTIVGRVVAPAGQPVGDAVVAAFAPGGAAEMWLRERGYVRRLGGRNEAVDLPPGVARSEADGRFRIPLIEPGRATVHVEAEGYAPWSVSGVVVEEGRETDLGDVRLSAGRCIHGRVTDGDGKPKAGVLVSATTGMFEPGATAATGEDGGFEFAHLPPGDYIVMAQDPDRNRQDEMGFPGDIARVTLTEEQDARVDIRLGAKPGGVRLFGRVLRDGQPAPKAMLQGFRAETGMADARMARTNEEGRYEMKDLGPGPYLIVAEGGSGGGRHDLVIPEGVTEYEFNIATTTGVAIAGKVVRAKGAGDGPPARTHLFCMKSGAGRGNLLDAMVADARTEEQGTFKITGVGPGSYDLVAGADGFAPASVPVTVHEGAKEPVTVEIALHPATTATVTVKNSADEPVKGAAAAVFSPSGGRLDIAAPGGPDGPGGRPTGDDGVLHLPVLSPDPVDIVILAEGFLECRLAGVTERTPQVEARLSPAAAAVVTVRLPNGAPAEGAAVAAFVDGKPYTRTVLLMAVFLGTKSVADAEGRLRVANLPEGNVTLRATLTGYAPAEVAVVLRGGQTTDAAITLGAK
ncbi:MAG: carboxypeptidase regulatory-like domain-containing protein [Planctomycetes bacterium]|nr:carboxypeptidase regulatory-like domain-containing protein [Planctomycetota bacterium]